MNGIRKRFGQRRIIEHPHKELHANAQDPGFLHLTGPGRAPDVREALFLCIRDPDRAAGLPEENY